MPYISVVTPVYNAVDIVDELYRQLVENLETITKDFEIIMVNDADPTGSAAKIAALAQKDKRVKLIDLARNFGQHIAISAGLDYAEGEYIVVMDCDLQDPPNKIPLLLEELKKSGKEVVFTDRQKRKEGFLKKFYSSAFRKCMSCLVDKEFINDKNVGNFSIITHKAVLALRKLKEMNRCYFAMIQWCGFEIAFVPIEAEKRFAGKSGYTFWKSLKHAFRILLQTSVKPLYLSIIFCILCFIGAVGLVGVVFYNYYTGHYTIAGYASIMTLIAVVGAMLFFILAVMSMYLATIFQETHRRPLYIIGRSLNIEEK